MASMIMLPWNGEHHPGRMQDGLPTFAFRNAPRGLFTARQLRDRGLTPGRHGPVAQLVWRRGQRWAALYRLDTARPRPGATTAQLAALYRARLALRTCRGDCGHTFPYQLPRSTGRRCSTCTTSTTHSRLNPHRTPAAHATSTRSTGL